ncbi:hypothetical protein EYR41_001192 [Orbilia oligospora]|uniref:tRNA (adenine(58)-N(1))-methyltransferase catalytic subunit TRM61 n=1 Tax=Orbilia oligospora TaxID=2813651 RepID=A0A7C8K4C8_ORBOL|nr:hypothetical protein TWF751_002840 [Orbilia oligospora]TGJ74155.1 hypothetical protein EYR41_001192 [Orbilia oligospora]
MNGLRQRSSRIATTSLGQYRYPSTFHGPRRHMNSNARTTKENDCVYLKPRSSASLARDSVFIPNIKPGKVNVTHKGNFSHDSLIGRRVRDVVKTNTGAEYLITFPTMEEYIVLSNRIVTPIYPADAAAIVQSLDLHVSAEVDPENGPLEVLEAGTGHGSLTLHLARALYAGHLGKENPVSILHSVEKDRKVHEAAMKLLKGFRRGIYDGPGVKFYNDDVEAWLRARLPSPEASEVPAVESTSEESTTQETSLTDQLATGSAKPSLLSACVLDLPEIRPLLPLLQENMHLGAILGYWAPSITQISAVVEHVKLNRLPFLVEKVLEFGNGVGGAGARVWDVRPALVRSRVKANKSHKSASSQRSSEDGETETTANEDAVAKEGQTKRATTEWEMVCRPKTGERTVGGGFYLIMRRIGRKRYDKSEAASEAIPSNEIRDNEVSNLEQSVATAEIEDTQKPVRSGEPSS